MRLNDAIIGALFLALALFIGIYGYRLPPMPGQPYGAGAFPIVIALGLGGFSLILLIRGLRARTAATSWAEFAPWARAPGQLFNFVLTLVLILVHVLLSERIGFIPLSIAILLVLFVRRGVPPMRAAAIAVAATLVIQVAFGDILRVPLPRGLLTDIMW